jgi:phospholipase/carboxylesterase
MSNRSLNADSILAPASGGRPKALVMLLHGVGANGEDLMSLAEAWQELLPGAVFVSPHAPEPYDGGYPDAYQWFSLEGITPDNRMDRVVRNAPMLSRFIDEQLALYHLTDRQLALVGFSQGTIMALFMALKRPRPCAALLGYSGRLAGAESIEPVFSRPRILLIHGTADQTIPVSELYAAENALKAHHVPVVAIAEPGVPHCISPEGELLGGQFLKYCLETEPTQEPAAFIAGMQPILRRTVR